MTDDASPEVGVTEADATLIAALHETGVDVTPRQLRRWRAAGLIPTPHQVSAGRGSGRRSLAYPAGTRERVGTIVKILKMPQRVELSDVPMWMFIFGDKNDLARVRASFKDAHRAFLTQLPAARDRTAIRAFSARAMGRISRTVLGKLLIQETGEKAIRRISRAGGAAQAAIDQFLGETPSMSGMRTLARSAVTLRVEDEMDVMRSMRAFKVHRMEADLASLTDEQLIQAHDNGARFLELAARSFYPDQASWPQHLDNWFARLHLDAHGIMMIYIHIAHLQERWDHLSPRLIEVLDDVRKGKREIDAPRPSRAI